MCSYRIVPFGDRWWVVEEKENEQNVFPAATHAEALGLRRSLLNEQPPPDEYDYYIEM